jgi:uncharacterized membrane protein
MRGPVMSGWIPPRLAYIVLLGAAGVTAKLALRTITWQQLVLWVPLLYLAYSAIFVTTGIVTVIGSGLFLSEKITLIRDVGTALVVAGVVLLSR